MASKNRETSAMKEHNGCCCHCNKIMAVAIILLLWVPAFAGKMWATVVITILAALMAMSHSQCMMCKMKSK